MINLLQSITSFIRTVEAGTIAGGARALGVSAAAVSQNIARLEQHLGVRLLNRTTRSLSLTERGTVYYEQVRSVASDLEQAHRSVTDLHAEPEGRLRIATTAAFGRHVLAPLLPSFRARYPRLAIEVVSADRSVHHAQEQVDVSLRIRPQLEDGLVARCIAAVPFVFCASPGYLARAGTPVAPEQLIQHDCLLFRSGVDGRYLRWGFVRQGLRFDADVRPALVSDDIDALAAMAAADGGITRLAAFVAQPYLDSGRLRALFAFDPAAAVNASPEPMQLYLCVSDRRDFTPKVRAFQAHLSERLPPAWRA